MLYFNCGADMRSAIRIYHCGNVSVFVPAEALTVDLCDRRGEAHAASIRGDQNMTLQK
jgi:hypothetical protein